MSCNKDIYGYPKDVGLYSAEFEKDACGVGFVVNINGNRNNEILEEALIILKHMRHRGGCGCDQFSGDGTGIMTAIPHELYNRTLRDEGFNIALPEPGHYATGLFFVQNDPEQVLICKELFERLAAECHIQILGWRKVAVNWDVPGPYSHLKKPAIEQVFVSSNLDKETFKKQVFLLRKMASARIPNVCERFYICSLSTETIVYKGMLTVNQLAAFYIDLQQKDFKSHFAIVHNRFSTNTFPSWERAHPQRFLAHNGEINTLKGNINNMRAREGIMSCEYYQENLEKLFPVIEPGMSDSGCVDNAVEFLVMAGNRSLPEAIMTMVPEAWQNDKTMPTEKRDYYKWSSCAMEPWDGPALFTFSDGRYVGAVLDRNGLRPSRFYITTDGRMVMASEVGVSSVADEIVESKGRLMPGRLLLVDTHLGRVIKDHELKHNISSLRPVTKWLTTGLLTLKDFHDSYNKVKGLPEGTISVTKTDSLGMSVHHDRRLPAFGYSVEDISMLVLPMIRNRKEAIGSMGNDTPLACLTMHPQLLFDYFKQLFAQVTNPPIDPFRETIVISLACPIGPESNLLKPGLQQCQRLYLDHPIISCGDLEAIKGCYLPKWKAQVINIVYDVQQGIEGLVPALDNFCKQASEAIKNNCAVVILSDRFASKDFVPVSSLLALGAVHHYLLKTKQRPRISIIVETAEAREIHHFCLLLGYGADAICPYLVFEIVSNLRQDGLLDPPLSDEDVFKNLLAASFIGISKVMAKMGISTLQSYKAAQIFEAVGIHEEVIQKCFTGTASRISGVTFKVLAQETLDRHKIAYADRDGDNVLVNNSGEYHWRDGGEKHINDPRSIGLLQDASRGNNSKTFRKFVESTWRMVKACTLRGQMDLKFAAQPLDLDEVEPASSIVKRFCTGAMSFGSISIETHKTLAVAMNRMGGKSNTGEGGEKTERLVIKDELNNTRSAIKQIASGRFGVNSAYLAHADDLQIKMAQGAKPGEGGELPGHKVTPDIARTRHSTLGVALISPPPHHDIYSIEDLAELIFNLKCSNPKSRISVKLVSEVGVGVIAAGVAKGHAEHIVISGHDGGTGASSWTGIKHAGLPWELGLSETHQTLVMNNLRRRIILQTDGQLRTGRDVVFAALLGADEFGFSTAPLISLGCTMMRKCHLNTCPVGIATQDPVLRKKFDGKPEYVVNYFFMIAEEVRDYMAKLGFRTVKDMVGQTQCIVQCANPLNEKTKLLDFGKILVPASSLNDGDHHGGTEQQEFGIENRKEDKLIDAVQDVLRGLKKTVSIEMNIENEDRSFGTTTSYHISRKLLDIGLPEDSVSVKIKGSAGQSFGAFICRGITLELEGDANDYVGKGLSGGKIILYPSQLLPKSFKAEENIIAGNVCLYGATDGKAYFRGITAERFCVRNSGAIAVCEGCGDHGCEYMTGGTVVILGTTGRNFAAGMSGGIAYILDRSGQFPSLCNADKVDLDCIKENDAELLQEIIQDHYRYTNSTVAKTLLENWTKSIDYFVKVIPREYKLALQHNEEAEDVLDVDPKATEQTPANEDFAHEIIDIEETVPKSDENEEMSLDKQRGFVKYKRRSNPYRAPQKRMKDWKEIYNHPGGKELKVQAARCMDCGVPFCQSKTGCPLGNVIPKWNDLVFNGRWQDALDRLLLTNNFPEFTGRVCPAPCEGACVLTINSKPVTIKSIECKIIDVAFEKGWMQPQPPQIRTNKTVAIIGSGPAGLAAAAQLNKAGHRVTVYEKNDKCGGLLMYGIPTMKIEKEIVQRRLNLLSDEGIKFVPNTDIGKDISGLELTSTYHAVLLAIGSSCPRDLQIPGRELKGVHFAMEFLEKNQKKQLGSYSGDVTDARGKNVIVIGGGDTGVDCVGTCVRQNAKTITTFELLNEPPKQRGTINPWPQWPRVFRIEYGHEEVSIKYGKDPRRYNTLSKEFVGDEQGHVTGIKTVEIDWIKDFSGRWVMHEIADSEKIYEADLVLIALGFTGPGKSLAIELGLKMDMRSNFLTEKRTYDTNIANVYAAGDCRYGQSLVVTAIAEGRQAARQIDLDLMGTTSLAGPGGVVVSTCNGTALKAAGKEILQCYNRGCGKDYSEEENSPGICAHHPGGPVFHDALKGWSCCQRRVTDFTEFLSIKGCTKSMHSNIKPPEAEVKPNVSNEAITNIPQTRHRKPEIKQQPRPSDDLPFQRLRFSVSDSLKKALLKQNQTITSINDDGNEQGGVQKGTSCKNSACNSVYQDESSNSENCVHHPGNPVFHEGYKFWSCCLRRTCDFDDFLKQEGCSSGSHVWFLSDEQKKKAVACRFDYYQMGSSVVVSVYAKLCDPQKSFIDANQTCMKAKLIFENASKFELDIKLHGVIDPGKSAVTYSATKVEITLIKKEASNWPDLELKLINS